MIGVSGCFGAKTAYPIDDINEAEAAVEEIVETEGPVDPDPESPGQAPDLALAQLVGQFVRRVRLLTWAFAALFLVLMLKEVD